MKLSVREAETIIKILTPAYCPIPKQVIILIFISLIFLLFIFPANISDFFSLCYLFSSYILKTISFRVTIPQGQHHVSSAQQSWALFCGIRTWMSDQKRIPRVVITSFCFSFPFEDDLKDCRTPQPCVMSLLLFLNYLFLLSPRTHSRVYLQYRTIVQINSQ